MIATLSMRRWIPCCVTVLGLTLGSGCVSFTPTADLAQQQADMDALREDVQRLKERVGALEAERQTLYRDLETMQTALRQSQQPLVGRVDELDRKVQALNAAREQDRRAIVDELSRRVTAIVSSSASSGGSSSSRRSSRGSSSSSSSSGGSEYGYEHVVKSGETLSAIAKAYGVSSASVLQANKLKDANSIRVGQKLFIPDTSGH